jgi:DNA-binding NarL/FixJ family response regulator
MRTVIVADNTLAAEALRRELRHVPGCRVIGFVNGRHPCGIPTAEAEPDVVIVDDMTAHGTALARIREIRVAVPDAKVVLVTTSMDPDWLAEAGDAGIDAAIAKTTWPTTIGLLVREVAAGHVFHAFARTPPSVRRSDADVPLTARELEILRSAAGGASNGQIADQLYVTEQTVKFHLSNVYRKLGVANRTEAAHFAHVHGLVNPIPARAIPAQPLGSMREAA